ncbi:DNA polymerase III subunit gamma/tau [Desulfopila sp. IMCC35006]|uniref:DNA polymerase III subunit gamma/tau n=1 Tax=Desulfopila sp. IMCC35006 TaxID=2569542 RepID=UPI0010AB872B|nr:DNA polymerase III subunit gamma/tau [Desulfopila sp. IMCC35006]TKB23657.1 DNA polymerase III subunit gamma/tau [Desulfopila sp. IMCC35006]
MSYLVLARKARPQTFDQVIGQRPVVTTLKNSIIRNRVAHAILFSGVRGVGKTTLARIMAKAINCQAAPESRPCDQCPSCRQIATGSSLDLYEIDGASNRGIQEIRELKEKIRFLPTSSQYKIIIIDEVHMLTTEAFNALLKTLEEPPAHVYFMFATTEIHKIPITILSRCQQYELKRVSAKELFDHFQKLVHAEGFEIAPEALSLIVREAGGSVRDGLSLLDQMFSYGAKAISNKDVVEVLGLVSRDVLMRLTKALLDGNKSEVFLSLQEIFDFGMDLKRFVEDLMDYFRTLLLCKIEGCAGLIDLPGEELLQFQEIAADYTSETLHLKLSLLMAMADDLKFSAQPRLTLETSFLKIIEASNVVPVSSLLSRLDAMLAALPEKPTPLQEMLQEKKPVEVKKKIESSAPPVSPQPPIEKETTTPESPPVAAEQPAQPPPAPEHQAAPPPAKPIEVRPHEKDIRKDWLDFIKYISERKVWMAQDLQRADKIKQDINGELHLSYSDPANCSLLRQKENHQLLTEFALDFFQKPLKVRFILPKIDETTDVNGDESPHRKRQQLVNDPLVVMAAEIFNGQVGDIRIGPRSR